MAKRADKANISPERMPRGPVAGLSFDVALNDLFKEAFREALTAAVEHLATGGDACQTFEAHYLANKGFRTMTGGIDETTIKQVANAVAKAYQENATFAEIQHIIRHTFADFSDSRVTLIAQTELSNAYNAGIMELARDAGAELKSWHTTGPNPCAACIENEAAGRILINQPFPSGHQCPCGHDGCSCDVKIHAGVAQPGLYHGRHFSTYVNDIKAMIGDGREEEAERILLELVKAIEHEGDVKGQGIAPWYYERLAIIYRRRRDYGSEIAILERYCEHQKNLIRGGIRKRLENARGLLAKASDPPTTKQTTRYGGKAERFERGV